MKRLALLLGLALLAAAAHGQGPLAPDAVPAPTMKTLGELQPRIPITNVPCTLWTSGSYYLTNNLVCTNDGADGITINASGVTIDLCGFTLSRSAAGTGYGVNQDIALDSLTVSNGTLTGWSIAIAAYGQGNHFEGLLLDQNGCGLLAGRQSRVANCMASHNVNSGLTGYGIYTEAGCVVTRCIASGTWASGVNAFGYGIHVGSGSVIEDCIAFSNENSAFSYGFYGVAPTVIRRCVATKNLVGICAETGSEVSDCVAAQNYGSGIELGAGGRLAGTVSAANGNKGVSAGDGCAIDRCLISSNGWQGLTVDNGSTVKDCDISCNGTGSQNGLEAASDCVMLRNHCSRNAGAGIYVGGMGSRLENNQCSLNATGFRIGNQNNLLAGNLAWANTTTNYDITTGNNYGEIIVKPGAGFGTDSAWANFSF